MPKSSFGYCFVFALLATVATLSAATANSWSLASPGGDCAIVVTLDREGKLAYEARRGGAVILPTSPLGLRRDDQSFAEGLALEKAGPVERRRERYELLSGNHSKVDRRVNYRSLVFRSGHKAPVAVDLAASDEGVAFRYRFPDQSPATRVLLSELTGFTMPDGAQGWLQPYHAAGQYTPAYEDFYYRTTPGTPPSSGRGKAVGWGFPALFQMPAGLGWALITESGTDQAFCACHLDANTTGNTYRIAFPLADEATRGQSFTNGPEPRFTLPWTMPWRVIVMAQSPAEIAMSTLVTDVAPPSNVHDAAWVRPGRASWSWWAYPEERNTVERYNAFTDFAARMSWEYTLFDGGWWQVDLKQIARHAKDRGVIPLAWSYAGDFYDGPKRRRKLDELATGGARGVKADFWCSDRQESIAAMHGLFADAAARQMVVDLHGCTLPRGWHRTWPNFLTAEAVLGTESYFYEPKFPEKAAELNTVLPFTRNVAGPMDYTPVAGSPKKYARLTTAAHELATALIFTSGLVCYADKPEFLDSLPPEALAILRAAPARWDESRCLIGEPGKAVVFARRAGSVWFIAGINGTDQPLPLELDLRAFRGFRRRLLVTEGAQPRMEVAARFVIAGKQWTRELPPRGGFILKLEK